MDLDHAEAAARAALDALPDDEPDRIDYVSLLRQILKARPDGC